MRQPVVLATKSREHELLLGWRKQHNVHLPSYVSVEMQQHSNLSLQYSTSSATFLFQAR